MNPRTLSDYFKALSAPPLPSRTVAACLAFRREGHSAHAEVALRLKAREFRRT